MSATETIARSTAFDTIVVVGGGCYGSYYVRQLGRAAQAGAISCHRIAVVDRDRECAVTIALRESIDSPLRVDIVEREWLDFFREYLGAAAGTSGATRAGPVDAIVPSPLMPHLMADWLIERARSRWPDRAIEILPLATEPRVPWHREGADGTHYVSFATWICPINCIEPRICPHTRELRDWTMPDAVRAQAIAEETESGIPTIGIALHCEHRAYGVGMFDTADVIAADAEIARAGAAGSADVLIGTVSHCHGALRRMRIH
jgi:hypothetical protein